MADIMSEMRRNVEGIIGVTALVKAMAAVNQRARGSSEAERICKANRREGESFDEILERLCAEGGAAR